MSGLPENELDLEKLFLPAWAQEPPSAKHYAQYEGTEEETRGRRRERPGRRPDRRDAGPGARQRAHRPGEDRRSQGPRRDARNRPFDKRAQFPGTDARQRREPPPPLPEITVMFLPDERGVESLARQIRTNGRAYPLFDIARLILQKPERYSVTFRTKTKPDGEAVQPLFICALDETLWLSEDEAVGHVLKNHFATFYQPQRTATEPPKGKYTFVAQCGLSGVILGPPNHHDYQNHLRKLHAERFSRMPFEAFKSRVKIVRDESVVKKWIEDQSWKTEYVCLNVPEPLSLVSREAVEHHFREVHKDTIIKRTDSHALGGTATRALRSRELTRLLRQSWEDQKRFPLQIATALSHQFAGHGLQFFKVNRSITHVSVARPHYLDLETTPVSSGVKRIVEFINAHPKCTRRNILDALTPAAQPPPAQSAGTGEPAPVPAGDQSAAADSAPAGPAASAQEAPVQSVESSGPTPEQTAVIADLHWLIHQGHVIEFANGILETAKKPLPKPAKPQPPPADASTAPVETESVPGTADTEVAAAPAESPAEPVAEPAAANPEAVPSAVAEEPPREPAPDQLSAPAVASPQTETPDAPAESAS